MMLRVKHRVPCETQSVETDEALRERLADEGIRLQVQVVGKRRLIRHGGKLCSSCLINPPIQGQRYCGKCHADANKKYRNRVKQRYMALCAKIASYEGLAT